MVLRALARSRMYRASSILIAEKRLERLEPLLRSFDDRIPVFAAEQPVMDAMVGFSIHRGVLAYAERGPVRSAEDVLSGIGGHAEILVLIGVANHDNVGAAFRNAAAFGAKAVLLDPTCCDPLYRKAIRVSVGAALLMPFARLAPGEDLLGLLARHRFRVLALSPSGAMRLVDLKGAARTALLIGAEGPGLPPQLLAQATTLAIPMAAGFDSLNLATAAGVVLNRLAELRDADESGSEALR